MKTSKRIVVVGGGMGGLATAAALQQRGFDARVYEQASKLTEVGAGIQMTPNAVKVLRGLGVEARLDEFGFQPDAIVGLDWKRGVTTFRTPLRAMAKDLYGASYYHIHRADLQTILKDAVDPRSITLGARCVSVENTSGGALARFADGSEVEADLIVAADGIHSVARKQHFADVQPVYTGNMCWRAIIPMDPPDFELVLPSSSMWFGPKGHVVTYYVNSGRAVNVVAIYEDAAWHDESWTIPSSREELCAAYKGWHPRLLRLLERAEHIYKWGLFDHDPMRTWTAGRITLLGDAAHPMLPFLSQGAAMAMEDGYVLARALEECDSVERALEVYEHMRIPRTGRVQLEARARGRSYHLQSPWQRIRRDIGHLVRNLIHPHAGGLQASWVYEHDVTTVDLHARSAPAQGLTPVG